MTRISKLIVVLAIGLFACIGCEDESDSNASNITKSADVVGISLGRTQIELSDGYALSLVDGAVITKQRASCSGFEYASPNDIAIGDVAEYTYINTSEYVDYVERTINPAEIKLWRYECLYAPSTNPPVDYILDTDQDGVADQNDADPNDPNVQ